MCVSFSRNIAECVQNVSVGVTVSGRGWLCFDLFNKSYELWCSGGQLRKQNKQTQLHTDGGQTVIV